MFEKIAAVVIGLIFIILFAFIGFLIYRDATADKIELTKDSWHCTKTEMRTTHTMVGKVMVPVIQSQCTQWTEN